MCCYVILNAMQNAGLGNCTQNSSLALILAATHYAYLTSLALISWNVIELHIIGSNDIVLYQKVRMRLSGFEPKFPTWKAGVLARLNYRRNLNHNFPKFQPNSYLAISSIDISDVSFLLPISRAIRIFQSF